MDDIGLYSVAVSIGIVCGMFNLYGYIFIILNFGIYIVCRNYAPIIVMPHLPQLAPRVGIYHLNLSPG